MLEPGTYCVRVLVPAGPTTSEDKWARALGRCAVERKEMEAGGENWLLGCGFPGLVSTGKVRFAVLHLTPSQGIK